MINGLKPLLVGTVALITLTASLTWCGNKVSAIGCDQTYRNSGIEFQYTFSSGCMVKTDGGVWVSSKTLRKLTKIADSNKALAELEKHQ